MSFSLARVPDPLAPTATVPIVRLDVRSFLTNLADGATVPANAETRLRRLRPVIRQMQSQASRP
jgi:hypothetical protein